MSLRLAGCVLKDQKGRFVLLHRNKGGVEQWELPGGKVDPGENEEQTAVREIAEELGVVVAITRHLGGTEFQENGTVHIYSWFLAEIRHGEPHICEPQTFDDMKYFSVEELGAIKLSSNMNNLLKALRSNQLRMS